MAKCQQCGNVIEGAEITYRDASKGSRRTRSIRLCSRCVGRYDTMEAAKKVRNTVFIGVIVVVLIVLAGYLLMYR